jgi:hypothetical protein
MSLSLDAWGGGGYDLDAYMRVNAPITLLGLSLAKGTTHFPIVITNQQKLSPSEARLSCFLHQKFSTSLNSDSLCRQDTALIVSLPRGGSKPAILNCSEMDQHPLPEH